MTVEAWTVVFALISVVVSAVTSWFVSPLMHRKQQKKDAQEQLLLRLLNTWLTPANPEYQAVTASISLVYSGSPEVLRKKDVLLSHANSEQAQREEGNSFGANAQNKQAALISEMGKAVGVEIGADQLLRTAYLTKGYVDRERMMGAAFEAWPEIAGYLKRNVELTERLLDSAVEREV